MAVTVFSFFFFYIIHHFNVSFGFEIFFYLYVNVAPQFLDLRDHLCTEKLFSHYNYMCQVKCDVPVTCQCGQLWLKEILWFAGLGHQSAYTAYNFLVCKLIVIGLCRLCLTKNKKKLNRKFRTPILTQTVESVFVGWEERARGLPPEAWHEE